MNHPAINLQAFEPVARPAFGLVRPIEMLIGFGQTSFVPTQFLYWAGDHLLLVRRENTLEHYRRIQYADIQGLQVVQNSAYQYFSLIALALAIAGVGAGMFLYQPAGAFLPPILCAVVAVLALCCAVANWAIGPTCRCTLLTAVEAIPLPAVARFRRAERFAEELQRRVAKVQGPLPPFDEGTPVRLTACQALLPGAARAIEPRNLNWHIAQMLFFALSWLLSMMLINYAVQEAPAYPLIGEILSGVSLLGYVICASMALGRQRTMDIGEGLKQWTVWSLLLTCGSFFILSMIVGFVSMDPTFQANRVVPLELSVVDLALNSILLLVGVVILREELRRPTRQPATS